VTTDAAARDALSIAAAARAAGGAPALRVDERSWTFAELAAAVAPRAAELARERDPWPLTGSNSLDTLLTLYALLEVGRPALLLHPKLTPHERSAELAATAAAARTLPADAAAIIYTSGTTGRARGAVLTREALLASAAASAANLGWADDDCWLLAMPLARVGGLSIVTRCLAARRAVALAGAFDAQALPRQIVQHRATLLSLVPTMLVQLFDAHPHWRAPDHLRAVLVGGAPASPRLLARAAERGVPVVLTYGCTETCSQVVATPYAARHAPASVGAGRPLPGVQLRIEHSRILVRGPMRMAGYLGEAPLAADAWFDTGDLGTLDASGALHLHARRSDLIVSGGENVYPAEVEHVLEACPGVHAAAVFGLADETWGEVVAAALVTGPQPPPDRVLVEHLAARLAPHKRPRRIGVVPELPLTPAGKLDRAALAALSPSLRPLSAH
jgi:O-succinylbenzoic acid--CoA ligase